jgi:hypothetical protein
MQGLRKAGRKLVSRKPPRVCDDPMPPCEIHIEVGRSSMPRIVRSDLAEVPKIADKIALKNDTVTVRTVITLPPHLHKRLGVVALVFGSTRPPA